MGRKASAAATVWIPCQRSSATRRSCRVSHRRSTRPLAWGECAANVPDAEVVEHLPEVGGMLGALEFFLEAPVEVVAHEDAQAIAVEGHGQPVAGGELPEQGEIAMQIFRGPEVQGQDGAGRIVDRPEEDHGRPRAEPVELTAVDEDEAAHRWVPGAAGPVLGGPAAPLRGQAERPAEAADRLATDREAFDVAELLGAVAVIEVPVRRLDELEHSVPDLALQRPGRGPAPEAVDQPPDPLGPIPGLEAAELPRGHVQGVGPRDRRDLPRYGQLHQARPPGLLATHRDGLPCLHGRTFLQHS